MFHDYAINLNADSPLSEAMAAVNLPWPNVTDPPFDGQYHPFTDPESSSRPESNKAAWFRGDVLPDGTQIATFGSFRRPGAGPWHWCSADKLTPDQQAHLEQIKAEAQADRQKKAAEAARLARQLWESATLVKKAEHPYLQRKGVEALGALRISQDGLLLVPLRDTGGELHTLNRIWPDGSKRLWPDGDPRGHYCRLGPKPTETIYICEGIATGLTIAQAMNTATVSCGDASNLAPVAAALRRAYPAVELIIAADADQAGRDGAVAAMQVAGVPTRMISPVFTTAGAGKDWNDLMLAEGLTEVQHQLTGVGEQPQRSAGPDPLRREPPPPEPYPTAALGPILAPAVEALTRIIQAPPAMIAQSLLAAAAYCVQPHATIVIDGRAMPMALYCISIGASGERKSAVDSQALKPITEKQRELVDLYRLDARLHKTDLQAFEKAERELGKDKVVDLAAIRKNRDEKIAAIAAIGDPPEPPLIPNLLITEPTSEGVYKLYLNGHPSLGLFSDEGGLFIGGHAMQKETRLRTIATLSKLWDGRPIDRVRSGDGASVLYDRRLSLHLMMQPLVASELFSDPIYTDQGFLARVLCAWPESTAGHRRYVHADPALEPALQRYWAVLSGLLNTPYPLRPDSRNELQPRLVPLSADAKRVWVAYADCIESQLADGQPLETLRGFASKAAEHAARIAGVLAMLENPNTTAIGVDDVQAGISLMDYYLTEALRLQAAGIADPDLQTADRLRQWCADKDVVHLREIYQHGPRPIRDAETARQMVGILVKHGWLIALPTGQEVDGVKRKEAWRVVRVEG